MSNIKNHFAGKFTTMPNQPLNDPDMSLKAKGLLCFMLSKPNEWEFSVAGLRSQLKEGRDSISNALNELIKKGYIKRTRSTVNGQFNGYDYELYWEPITETPLQEKPLAEIPLTENTLTENQPQVNTILSKDINKAITKKEKTNKKDLDSSVDDIYTAYPSKCVVQNRSTGKSKIKNKPQIRKLLNSGVSQDELTTAIAKYVDECRTTKTFMKNFTTFLNQLPDISDSNDTSSFIDPKYREHAKSFLELSQMPSGVTYQELFGASYSGLAKMYKAECSSRCETPTSQGFDDWLFEYTKNKFEL